MDDAETAYLIREMTQDYYVIWDKLNFITEDHAHARATNEIMVCLEKVKDYVKGYLATQPSAAASTPAPPQTSQTATVPPKAEEGTAKLQDAPSPTPQPNRINTPPYDAEKKRWNYCEAHPDEEIKHFSEKTNRYYYACFECDEFLQADGSRKPMGAKK